MVEILHLESFLHNTMHVYSPLCTPYFKKILTRNKIYFKGNRALLFLVELYALNLELPEIALAPLSLRC